MIFVAEDNPKLYICAKDYNELKEKIRELENPNYDYEIIIEPSFKEPVAGKIRAIKKSVRL